MSHVLIVDDEESICWGLGRLLTETGHRVSVAASAEAALESVGQARPDLVVLDVRLPGIDGLSAMRHLTNLAGPIPIVVVTGHDVSDLDEADFAGVLHKPLDPNDLISAVRGCLPRAGRPFEPT